VCGEFTELYECVDGSVKMISSTLETAADEWSRISSTRITDVIEDEINQTVTLVKEGWCGTWEEVYECVDGQLKKITDSASGASSSMEQDLQEIVNIINALAGREVIDFQSVFEPATEEAKAMQDLLLNMQRDLESGAVTGLHIGGGLTPEMEQFMTDVETGMTPPDLTYPGLSPTTNIYVEPGAVVIQAEAITDVESAQVVIEDALDAIADEVNNEYGGV
jgi:hypothetical protein